MKKLSCITLAVFLTFIAVSCLAEKTLNKMEFIDYNTEHFKFSAPAWIQRHGDKNNDLFLYETAMNTYAGGYIYATEQDHTAYASAYANNISALYSSLLDGVKESANSFFYSEDIALDGNNPGIIARYDTTLGGKNAYITMIAYYKDGYIFALTFSDSECSTEEVWNQALILAWTIKATAFSSAPAASTNTNSFNPSAMSDKELYDAYLLISDEIEARQNKSAASSGALASGTLGECDVSILGATLGTDYSGAPCIILNLEWQHRNQEAQAFFSSLQAKVFQNGIQCNSAIVMDSSSSINTMTEIKPNTPVQLFATYSLQDTTSPIEVEIEKFFDFSSSLQKVTAVIDLSTL